MPASFVEVDSTIDWRVVHQRRLSKSLHLLGHNDSLCHCTIGVLANEPMMRSLCWVLREDATRRPEISSHASSFAIPDDDVADGDVACLALKLARGDRVAKYLLVGAALLMPSDDTTPLHIRGFRSMFFGDTDLILKLWRVLLPGLAQLWFRLRYVWTQFPYCLLTLIDDKSTPSHKDFVADKLLSSPSCCLDAGLSRQLRAVAEHVAPQDVAAQHRFIRGPWVFAVLYNWSLSVQATIIDLECTNAHVRNFQVNGRPPCFSTTSAKAFLHDAENLFKARWHRAPKDHLHKAFSAFQALVTDMKEDAAAKACILQ